MAEQKWPRDYAGFEALPFIHSILKGARDGVDGVGILTNYNWLPEGTDGADIWGDTWVEARARWIRDIAPMLLKPTSTHLNPNLWATEAEAQAAIDDLAVAGFDTNQLRVREALAQ